MLHFRFFFAGFAFLFHFLHVQRIDSKNYAFWHVYSGDSCDASHIITEQLQMLNASGLLDELEKVFYTTVGNDLKMIGKDNDKFVKLAHLPVGNEVNTLSSIQKFCQAPENKDSKVLYFHDKGSYGCHRSNEAYFRRALDCFNLNPGCIDILDDFDTCGMRLAPVPSIHYTGNYWWANCHHIVKLIDPMTASYNQTFITGMNQIMHRQPKCAKNGAGDGRYLAEMWVGSLPNFQPADCMFANRYTKYLGGYDVPAASLEPMCPNMKAPTGSIGAAAKVAEDGRVAKVSTCGVPRAWKDPNYFKEEVHSKVYTKKCVSVPMMRRKSDLWYGQEPELFIDWMKKFGIN